MFRVNNIINFNLDRYSRISYIERTMKRMNFLFMGEGCQRRTYLSPNKRFVLKFPHNRCGLDSNRREAQLYSQFKGKPDPGKAGAVYAPCRLIQDSILMMRAMMEIYGGSDGCDQARDRGVISGDYVHPNHTFLPYWISSIDCGQVGILPDGRIVAYDFA